MHRLKVRDWNLVRNILAGARTFRSKPVKGGDTNILQEYQEEIKEERTMPMNKTDFLKQLDQHVHANPEEWFWMDGAVARLWHYTSRVAIYTNDYSTYFVETMYDGRNLIVLQPTDKIDLYAIFQRFDAYRREEERQALEQAEHIVARLNKKEVAA